MNEDSEWDEAYQKLGLTQEQAHELVPDSKEILAANRDAAKQLMVEGAIISDSDLYHGIAASLDYQVALSMVMSASGIPPKYAIEMARLSEAAVCLALAKSDSVEVN